MSFGKHFLAIKKRVWEKGLLSGHFKSAWQNLGFEEIPANWDNFSKLVKQIKTGVEWEKLGSHSEEAMRELWDDPRTRLFLLTKNNLPIGYSLITPANTDFRVRFNAANDNESIIQIENLALFDNYRGQGLGKSFFEMIFQELYKTYDVICWSTSDFNSPTLVKFYTDKMKMTVLGYDQPKTKVA